MPVRTTTTTRKQPAPIRPYRRSWCCRPPRGRPARVVPRPTAPSLAALDDVERGRPVQHAHLDRAAIQMRERAPARLAHVERERVHVHVDERAPALDVEAAAELERVADRGVLVV